MPILSDAVETFTETALNLTNDDLERAWEWKSYDSEGIRFAFFRAYEALLELSVRLKVARADSDWPLTSAQLILGQYHAAFRNLQALLLGIGVEIANVPPADDEWPVRRTLAHIVGADIGFYVAIKFALDRHRAGGKGPVDITEEAWEAISGLDDSSYKALMESSLDDLRKYHRRFHERILADFADISTNELALPSKYWEGEAMSVWFRLGRFASHMRQHTIQIEKTLSVVRPTLSEVGRLLSLIYNALAAAESALIGAKGIGDDLGSHTAEEIRSLSTAIAGE